ncbi:hypothetical protein SLEP1_g22403 [Rubroshorea leprosula]|uniref:Uncharacterized protein n=1 Tax=Rubroshorea leprosula TaxID=152421 RepID=A0AAV5JIF7_9ROSI|nr:hypothetical protein SLEP1_g22403 [Rubroshorea leprosula]
MNSPVFAMEVSVFLCFIFCFSSVQVLAQTSPAFACDVQSRPDLASFGLQNPMLRVDDKVAITSRNQEHADAVHLQSISTDIQGSEPANLLTSIHIYITPKYNSIQVSPLKLNELQIFTKLK